MVLVDYHCTDMRTRAEFDGRFRITRGCEWYCSDQIGETGHVPFDLDRDPRAESALGLLKLLNSKEVWILVSPRLSQEIQSKTFEMVLDLSRMNHQFKRWTSFEVLPDSNAGSNVCFAFTRHEDAVMFKMIWG